MDDNIRSVTKTYSIIKRPVKEAGETNWDAVPALAIDTVLWDTPAAVLREMQPTAKIAYDPDALYVRLETKEEVIRAEEGGVLPMPCLDSCLEFFFCPDEDSLRYFNIEFNPNAAMYLGLGDHGTLLRLLADEGTNPFSPRVERTEDGWHITYTVPVSFVRHIVPGFSLYPGKVLRANCYKCGDLTRTEHYLSWNPMTSETPQFHRPEDFGIMTLV